MSDKPHFSCQSSSSKTEWHYTNIDNDNTDNVNIAGATPYTGPTPTPSCPVLWAAADTGHTTLTGPWAAGAHTMLTDTGQTLITRWDFSQNKWKYLMLLQAWARASADAWSPRGSGDWGQVAPHLPLCPHQLLLQQPRPSPPEPGVHRWVIGSFVHICRDHCDVWQSQCDVSRVTKLFPGPHPSADVNRAPRSGERRGDGYKLSPTTKTLLIIVFRDGKKQK